MSARVLRGAHALASSPAVADVATERQSDAASEPASEQPVPRDTLANRPFCLIDLQRLLEALLEKDVETLVEALLDCERPGCEEWPSVEGTVPDFAEPLRAVRQTIPAPSRLAAGGRQFASPGSRPAGLLPSSDHGPTADTRYICAICRS